MISRIQIQGIHGNQDIDQELFPGLNILHAKNGAGKTTFLHVLANLFERDIERFCHLRFSKIVVTLDGGSVVSLRQQLDGKREQVHVEINGNDYASIGKSDRLEPSLDQLLYDKLGGRPVYLPAFRSILEGSKESNYSIQSHMSSRDSDQHQRIVQREYLSRRRSNQDKDFQSERNAESVAFKTMMCRGWFGEFVPVIRYPSLTDVDRALNREVRHAYFAVSRTDQRILSDIFLKVFDAIVRHEAFPQLTDTRTLLDQLVNKLGALTLASVSGSKIYSQLEQRLREQTGEDLPDEDRIKAIISIYHQALAERSDAETEAFTNIQRFLGSVNNFLFGKSIEFRNELVDIPHASESSLYVRLGHDRIVPLRILSSGERHVLTLLFSTTHMSSEDGLVLIDEPELSLHVDWQRIILSELMKQVDSRQVIACTHSPEIAAEHLDKLHELSFLPRESIQNESSVSDPADLASDEA